MDQSYVKPESVTDRELIIADSLIKISSHLYNTLIRRTDVLYASPIGILHFWPRRIHRHIASLVYRTLRSRQTLTFKVNLITDGPPLELFFDIALGSTRTPKRPPDPHKKVEAVLQNTISCALYQFFSTCALRATQYIEKCLRHNVRFKRFIVTAVSAEHQVFPSQTTLLTQNAPPSDGSRPTMHPTSGETVFVRSLVFHDPRLSVSLLLHWR